jgi:hypothetical protein
MSGEIPEPTRHDVRRVLEHLANERQKCPLCWSEIGTTTSLEHDRECVSCGTKFTIDGIDDDGNHEYRIDIRTTPQGRIRRLLRRRIGMKAVFNSYSDSEESV